jgi:hypothetical protein
LEEAWKFSSNRILKNDDDVDDDDVHCISVLPGVGYKKYLKHVGVVSCIYWAICC